MKPIILTLFLCLLLPLTMAAQRTITGTATESNGDPLIGATVLEEGTSNGTVTNEQGQFSIRLSNPKSTLFIAYTGFSPKRVEVGASNVIDVVLEADFVGLEQVVVVGYATQRRKDLTGAVSFVNANNTRDVPIPSIESALQGAAAGVMVNKNSGKPGGGIDVNIRGRTSILASNQPLYVVDGVPVISGDNFSFQREDLGGSSVSVLSDINPDEIESIEVLKDASTAAIYGSRAANGVVLIKTRRGADGKSKITLNSSYGQAWAPKKIEGITGDEYKSYSEELWGPLLISFGLDPTYQNVQDYLTGPLGDANTNWLDEIFRTAPQQEYSATLTGGTNKTKVFASLGYSDQQGIIKNSGFKRYSGRLNVDHKVTQNILFNMNLGYTRSNTQQVQNDNNIYGALGAAILIPPVIPIKNEDGTWGSAFGIENAVAAVTDYSNHIERGRLQGNIGATWSITNYLSLKASLGTDLINSYENIYEPRTLQSSNTGRAVAATVRDERFIHEYVLNFNKSFGKNSLQLAAGTSFQQDKINDTYASAVDFPSDAFTGLSSASTPVLVAGGVTGDNLKSVFSNLNYNFNDRYYLSASFRADGSSRFLNDKWGYFPGVSAGWIVSEEDFWSKSSVFNLLKLRLGWGQTGNNVFGNFLARQLYGGGRNYLNAAGTAPTQIGNANLTWETTTQSDLGLDFGFLNNRINGSVDLYLKSTKNLLLNRPIPTSSGFTSVIQNVGEVENKGIDLTLNSQNINRKNFSWTSSFTIGFVKNKVKKLVDGVPIDAGFDSRVAEGQPLGSFFGHVVDGIFQNQAEIDAAPTQSNAAPGDLKFKDISGGPGPDGILGTSDDLAPDGKVNDDDRTYIGKAIPDFTGGLRNTINAFGFDLNLFFQFAVGFQIDNANAIFAEGMNSVFSPTRHAWDNRWKKEGDQTDVPRLVQGDPNNNRRGSTRFIEDGDYIRLKTLTLGYTLPKSLIKHSGLESLRVYVSGYNLWTATKYSWFDPEVNTFDGANLALGTDFLTFPQPRSVVFGLNVGF